MKTKSTILWLLALLLISNSNIWSQDKKITPIPDWSINPAATRLYVSGNYPVLPPVQDNYVNPNTETRIVNSPIGTLVLPPNIRPLPRCGNAK